MPVEIRPLQDKELQDGFYSSVTYCFRPSPPLEDRAEWDAVISARKGISCHAAVEDSKAVTVAFSTPMTQNIRGRLYPACGIWGVATHPSARRKGYCRQVMASLLAADRESGRVLTDLYPFRESFYERMGYVSFPLTKIAHFSPLSLSPLLKMDLGGDVELKLIGEAFDEYREYITEMRLGRHGMGFFDIGDRRAAEKNRHWLALARFDGRTEGMMMYRLTGDDLGHFLFTAPRFYYRTSRARYLLLEWIARHADQADRVELWTAADETPETWLADLAPKMEGAKDAAMLRVLDVAGLSGMEVGEGVFSAQLIDPLCPWNEGIWKFASADGRLAVTKTSSADCSLTVQGLSALVAGVRNPQEFCLRGWGDPAPELQDVMRMMFPPRVPFMHEMF